MSTAIMQPLIIVSVPSHLMQRIAIKTFNHRRYKQMQKQTIEFAVETKNGAVQSIGKSIVYQPKTNFNGKGIKWYEDKPKKKSN